MDTTVAEQSPSSIAEFTIKQSDMGHMEKMKERVGKLYQVVVINSVCAQEEGNKMQWIKLIGPSKENTDKAKEYLTTLCNSCDPIEIIYPPQMYGILLDRHDQLEELSSAIILFKEPGIIHIFGSEIGITIAMSSVEDILSQYLVDPSVTVRTVKSGEDGLSVSAVDKPAEKTLTRQDSASSRLEAQLKLVCQQHDLSYDDYTKAPNSVKRVLLSWLDHDMDEADGVECTETAADYSVINLDLDESVICTGTSETDRIILHDSDSSIQEITDTFDRTLASPARCKKRATAGIDDNLCVSSNPTGNSDIQSSSLNFSASNAVREFALSKGYTNSEIDVVLKSKIPPYRTSDVIVDLFKNRNKSTLCENDSEVASSAMAKPDCPVTNYFELLSRDFNEETPHLSREEYMKRNKERQDTLSSLFKQGSVKPVSCEEDVSSTSKDNACTESVMNQNSVKSIPAGAPRKKRKKKKKKPKNQGNPAASVVPQSASGSDSDIQVVIPNNGKLASPVPHINKKRCQKQEINQLPEPAKIGDVFGHPKNSRELVEEATSESKKHFRFGAKQTGFDWETEKNQSARRRQHSGNSDCDMNQENKFFHESAKTTNAVNQKSAKDNFSCPPPRKPFCLDADNKPGGFDWDSRQSTRQRSGNSESDIRHFNNGSSIQAMKGQHLRPIVIDGSNVACAHGKNKFFSCRGIEICINYFLQRGHTEITAFVPNWRKGGLHAHMPTVNSEILFELENMGYIAFTPSRRIGKKNIVCYDDRFIVELAAENGGVIVSNDNYRDLTNHSNKWKNVIEKRLLMFTFVGDLIMIPQDPLGSNGPILDDFLTKDEFKRKGTMRVAQSRAQGPPVRPLRPIAIAVQLEEQLNLIFPGNNKIISRILENHPYEEDLNKLTTHILDVVQ